jgi:hypothetical protein
MGLFIDEDGFTLYDPIEDKVYAYISISKIESGNYSVGVVAAEYGYGPLIYELAMSYIYPHALLPSRTGDIRGGAINIWQHFLKDPKIKKERLTKKDPDFSWEIYEDMGNDPDFKFMQTRYYYNGLNNLLNQLLNNAKNYMDDGINLDDVSTMGHNYWLSRYE